MSLEDFKPEEGYKRLVAEVYHTVSGGFELKVTPIPGLNSPTIFVVVNEFKEPYVGPGSERETKLLSAMENSINGFGGALADMIRSCRLKLEAERKRK